MEKGTRLWQTNRNQRNRKPRPARHRAKAAGMLRAEVMVRAEGTAAQAAIPAHVARAVQAVPVVKAVRVVRGAKAAREAPADVRAASGSTFAKRKSASSVSKRWT